MDLTFLLRTYYDLPICLEIKSHSCLSWEYFTKRCPVHKVNGIRGLCLLRAFVLYAYSAFLFPLPSLAVGSNRGERLMRREESSSQTGRNILLSIVKQKWELRNNKPRCCWHYHSPSFLCLPQLLPHGFPLSLPSIKKRKVHTESYFIRLQRKEDTKATAAEATKRDGTLRVYRALWLQPHRSS